MPLALVSINGRDVSARRYVLVIEDRQIRSGRDDCNDWGYGDAPPRRDGQPTLAPGVMQLETKGAIARMHRSPR